MEKVISNNTSGIASPWWARAFQWLSSEPKRRGRARMRLSTFSSVILQNMFNSYNKHMMLPVSAERR